MTKREVKIRYVNFGTRFQVVEGAEDRPLDSETNPNDSRLFRNEFAFDVGGTCYGHEGETAWVLDHHFSRGDDNFPSASAAVLHNAAALIVKAAELNPQPECFWLVTHVNPDFDALLSVYLAKFFLQQCSEGKLPDGDSASFLGQRLHPDGWLKLPKHSRWNASATDIPRFAWFQPPLVDGQKRWMLLLASTACHVDNGRPLHCCLETSLPSVFYAALTRQRPYGGLQGAEEFFDAARERIMEVDLNPLWDPLFNEDSLFAPELTLLAGSEGAYNRDVARARKSIVHLPYVRDFGPYYARMKERELLPSSGTIDVDQQSFSTLPEIASASEKLPSLQVDGIWIRDPECILFRQFARADQRYAPGGQGFLFTAIVYSGAKSASVNRSDYFFSLDPERAAGRHLYPVWATLQAAEIQALVRDPDSCSSLRENPECRDGFEARAGSYGPLFRDPWFDGSNYEATIVATPSSGSSIQGEGTRSDLSDDTVAKLVSEFLENRNLTGEVTWRDYPMHTGQIGANEAPVDHLIGFQGVTPPIPTGNIRLVTAELAQEVDLSVPQTATQAGRQIWQFLYTDARGGVPTDFVTRHLILDPDIVCVWGRRGIALGTKPGAKARTESIRRLLDILTRVATVAEQEVVVLKRHLQGKCCDLHGSELLNPGAKVEHHRHFWRKRRKECHTVECQQNFDRLLDELYIQLADIAELQRQMAQPEGRFLYPFFQASRLDEILASVRESHNALSTRADNRTMRESLVKIQEVEENTDWMETIIIGVYLLELVNITSQPESRQHPWFLVSAWAGGLALASLAGWLGGRGRDRAAMQWAHRIARGMVIVWIAAIFFLGLFWTSFFPENKPVPPPSTIVVSGPQTNVDKPLTPEVKAPAANGLPGKPSEDSSAIPNHH